MSAESDPEHQDIGALLVAAGLITHEDLEQARRVATAAGSTLESALVHLGVSWVDVLKARARLGLPSLSLRELGVDPQTPLVSAENGHAIADVLTRAKRDDIPLPNALKQFAPTAFQSLMAQAHLLNFKAINLERQTPEAEALRLLPASFTREHRVLPICVRKDPQGAAVLIVAITSETGIETIDAIGRLLSMKVLPVLADADQLAAALEQHYVS